MMCQVDADIGAIEISEDLENSSSACLIVVYKCYFKFYFPDDF